MGLDMTHSVDLINIDPSGTGKSWRSQKSLPYSRLNSPCSHSLLFRRAAALASSSWPPLDLLQQLRVLLMLGIADPALQVGREQSRGQSPCCPAPGAAQHTFVSLGWGCSWLGRAELLLRAALHPLIQSSQPPKSFLSHAGSEC